MVRRGYLYAGILLVSAATLMFELTLTRIFAVADWYHFAFLSISVALFGYAGSGTLLSVLSDCSRKKLGRTLSAIFPLAILGAYYVINTIPFDSYQLSWSPRQVAYLLMYYASLIIPFGVSGFILSHWMAERPDRIRVYATNLIGSAIGTLGLLAVLPMLGAERTIMAAAALAALGGTVILRARPFEASRRLPLVPLGLLAASMIWILDAPTWAHLRLSPYKSLSYALQAGDARVGFRRWNAYSRVDVVESARIHSAPGLSLRFRGKLPPQHGLTIDGDNLSPISRRTEADDVAFLSYLPTSIIHRVRPQGRVLIIRPRGGLDVAVALHSGAREVVVVEDNPLVVQAVRDTYGPMTDNLYRDSRVRVLVEDGRSGLQSWDTGQGKSKEGFDIIQLSLAETFHPLTAASYSLSENYIYTVEGFLQAFGRLRDDGILVATRWLQEPPSESLRVAALMTTALERLGVSAVSQHIISLRSWSTMLLLASPTPFANQDIESVVSACNELGFDLVHYPGMRPEEANLVNQIPQPIYYQAWQRLLDPNLRSGFSRTHPYDVSPPTDDRPFLGHTFRWRQIPGIIAQLGKTWQPFGGSGFLLVLVLLVVATLAAVMLIVLPLVWARRTARPVSHGWRPLTYYAALGMGFLLIEMPLMQQFILYLGHPALSFIIVLSALLVASGIGSMLSHTIDLRAALCALIAAIAIYPPALQWLFHLTLSWALPMRMSLSLLCLLPLGVLLGMPFAGGLRTIETAYPGLVPWIWAINGSASVIGSILATILALSWGYRTVLILAAICYIGALAAFWPLFSTQTHRSGAHL